MTALVAVEQLVIAITPGVAPAEVQPRTESAVEDVPAVVGSEEALPWTQTLSATGVIATIALVPSPTSRPCAVKVVAPVPPPATKTVVKLGSAELPPLTSATPAVEPGPTCTIPAVPAPIRTECAVNVTCPVPPSDTISGGTPV